MSFCVSPKILKPLGLFDELVSLLVFALLGCSAHPIQHSLYLVSA